MAFSSNLETRSQKEDGKKKIIEGYFIKYNEKTNLWGDVYESVLPDSVSSSLENNDIRCLFNHDTGSVLGTTKNNTLTLKSDEIGLWGSVEINERDTDAMNIYERVSRGDINTCSFGFNVISENTEWREDGSTHFELSEIDLHEVSIVTFPAYDNTGVQAREKQIVERKQEEVERLRKGILEKYA